MSDCRFYCENITTPLCVLGQVESQHLSKVMRIRKGDSVEIFDGKGSLAFGTVEDIGRRDVSVLISGVEHFGPRIEGRIILCPSLAKGQRFDWLISKATELGVDSVIPTLYHRTVKQASGKSVESRFVGLAVSACKQCKRVFLPEITVPVSLEEAIRLVKEKYGDLVIVFGSLSGEPVSIGKIEVGGADIAVFVGPEGGFTAEEEQTLVDSGGVAVSLTGTVLRTETAALAAASVIAINRDGVDY